MKRIKGPKVGASKSPSRAEANMSAPRPGRVPMIGEEAPAFHAQTTQGPIDFPKHYKGKWVILFSHPADFTPVCTTEFMSFATLMPEFKALNCCLIGLSVDSTYAHIAWLRTIKDRITYNDMSGVDVTFPIIGDVKMQVARLYGMIHPAASDSQAVRAAFIIDPKSKIRAFLYYPLSNGRNFEELKRLLIALQTSDAHGCATPADWEPGDDVIVHPPGSCEAADKRLATPAPETYAVDWFMSFRKLPIEKLKLPPGVKP
jgi:peroxiredoxin (alkyl hydroperoxide reductase subunit C)